MLAMYMNSVSIGYGIALPGVGITMCIRPCAAIGASHENALSMRSGLPSASTSRSSGASREAERRAGSGLPAATCAGLAGRLRARRRRLRDTALVAAAAGHIDRAEQHLQQMQRAAGLEAVGMGRDAAHRVHRRPAGRRIVSWRRPAQSVHGCRSSIACSKATCGDLGGDAADRVGRDAAASAATASGAYSRVEIALGDQLEHRHGAAAVGQRRLADERGPRRRSASRSRASPSRSEHQRLAVLVAREQPVIGGARVAGSPARRRWCSGRDSRDRPGRRAAARGSATARTARRCRAGCRSIRRRSPNSRCAPG